MPYSDVNGMRLFFTDTGSGPAVVFSHGLLMDGEMFAPQVARFRQQYRCVTWDERGHGRTATDTLEPFSYYDSADDVAGLQASLGIDKAVHVGLSQGGFLVMRCALTHPDRVKALILLASQTGPEDPAKIVAYGQMLELWIAKGLPEQLADTVKQIIFGADWDGAEAWVKKWRQMSASSLACALQALFDRDDITERVREITVPTLIIHGEADAAIPMDRAEAMQAAIPGSELVVVPGAGHSVSLTHPDQTNAAIERFLAGLPAD